MTAIHLQPSRDNLLQFSHQAMATTFEILVQDPRDRYCRQAANEAFTLLDRLDQQLSRFITNSDISRINTSTPGQGVLVGLETIRCLLHARDAWLLTEGGFDVTIYGLMDQIRFDPETYTVTRSSGSVQIDLGGIGKGFALEQMAQVMSEWRVYNALLHAGSSTVLALDGQWPVSLSCPFDRHLLGIVSLNNAAMSCSSQIRRPHIIDPATGRPANKATCIWVLTSVATMADALSTGLMATGKDNVKGICDQLDGAAAFVVVRAEDNCTGTPFGSWPGKGLPSCKCQICNKTI